MASIIWIPVIFVSATYLLYVLSSQLPSTAAESTIDNSKIKFPSSLEEISDLASVLSEYKKNHLPYVFFLFSAAYLYKQTFAIPGSALLNILAGALFGVWVGFPLACILTATGATNCYFLSKCFGKSYVCKYFPDKIALVENKIEESRDSLFFFLLFLRLFPMSPNWFMNIVAPILGIPVHLFFASVLIGLMPYNFICIQTGGILSEIKSMEDVFTLSTTLKLLAVAAFALIPGLLMKKYKNKRKVVTQHHLKGP